MQKKYIIDWIIIVMWLAIIYMMYASEVINSARTWLYSGVVVYAIYHLFMRSIMKSEKLLEKERKLESSKYIPKLIWAGRIFTVYLFITLLLKII